MLILHQDIAESLDTQERRELVDTQESLENQVILGLAVILDTAESVVDPVIPELREYLDIVVRKALKDYQDTRDIQDWEVQDIRVFQDTAVQMAHLVIAASKDSLDSLVLVVTVGSQEYLVRLVIVESKESVDTPESKDFRVILEFLAPLDILESKESVVTQD